MNRTYAQQLTKDDLINKYGITAVDPIGKVYNEYGEFTYSNTKSGNRKYKVIFGYYRHKPVTLGVHRIV